MLKYLSTTLAFCLLLPLSAAAKITMPVLFQDSMVLQQDEPIRIFGNASEGAPIKVQFNGVEKRTVARNGKWMVVLDAMPAGGPFQLVVSGENERVVYQNVMLGEVWLASGQSNMAMRVKDHIDFEDLLPEEKNDQLRFIHIPVTEFGEINRARTQWKHADKESIQGFSAVAYFFAAELQKRLGVTVGIIGSYRGGTWNENWMTPESIKSEPKLKYLFEKYDNEYAKFENEEAYEQAYQQYLLDLEAWKKKGGWSHGMVPFAPLGPKAYQRPSGLYGCMIKPLQPYTIKGCIWYQGEGNSSRHEEFRTLFPSFVKGWRKTWENPNMPFYFVQLPPFKDESWPHFRQAQLECSKAIKHCGMVVSEGCGDLADIHPRIKKPIGDRLAIAITAEVYEQDHIPYGPILRSVKFQKAKAEVKFDYSGSGLVLSEVDTASFEIAGADKEFETAEVSLQGDSLLLWNSIVGEPKYIRYAYKPNPRMVLFNKEGLPASPFTTER
jgi:sialate O-acetylesterase